MQSYLALPMSPRLRCSFASGRVVCILLVAALSAGCGQSDQPPAAAASKPAGEPDSQLNASDQAPSNAAEDFSEAGQTPAEPEAAVNDPVDPYAIDDAPPPELLPPPDGAERLSPEHRIWIDKSRSELIIDTLVSFREGYLEMFACRRNSKEHESILSADTQAYLAHAGLLALGAKSGTPVQFVPDYAPPTGAEIEITLQWRDAEGEMQSAQAQQWVRDGRTGKQMTEPWVFAGSFFVKDEETGQEYYVADQGGELICVSNFSTAMLDVPAESTQANEGLLYEAFTERIPPLGTPVRMILKPKPADKAE